MHVRPAMKRFEEDVYQIRALSKYLKETIFNAPRRHTHLTVAETVPQLCIKGGKIWTNRVGNPVSSITQKMAHQ